MFYCLEVLCHPASVSCRWIQLSKPPPNSSLRAQAGRSNYCFVFVYSTWPITVTFIPMRVITSIRNPHKYYEGNRAVSNINSNSESILGQTSTVQGRFVKVMSASVGHLANQKMLLRNCGNHNGQWDMDGRRELIYLVRRTVTDCHSFRRSLNLPIIKYFTRAFYRLCSA